MSIDGLGRIIVGSGHFIEKAPGIIEITQKVVVGGGHFVNGIQVLGAAGERASQALNASRQVQALLPLPSHVPVGSGHFINRPVPSMHCIADASGNIVDMVLCGSREDDAIRQWEKQQQHEYIQRQLQAHKDHFGKSLEKWESAGWCLGQSIGQSMSGNHAGALSHAFDAATIVGEDFWESFKWAWKTQESPPVFYHGAGK